MRLPNVNEGLDLATHVRLSLNHNLCSPLDLVGMGRVSFSALGSGFGVLDFARVGFRVKLRSIFFSFFSQFGCIWQKIGNISQKKLLLGHSGS